MTRHAYLFLLLPLAAACTDYELHSGKDPETHDSEAPPEDTERPADTSDSTPPPSCDDFEAPEPTEATQDETCYEEAHWTPGTFDPVIEWQWGANPLASGYDHIMAAPAIGEVTDDDSDGVVDEDDIPDIAFTTFSGNAYGSAGALSLISGDGSGTHWSKLDFGGYHPYSSGGVAIADLEGDGAPEILVAGVEAAVLAVNANGSLKWAGGSATAAYGCPAVADMDGDGCAEVIFGAQILDCTGAVVGVGSSGTGGSAYQAFAADMDADGQLEVVAGNAVYERDGSTLWTNAESNGTPAVADFDGDGEPEVVTTGDGYVTLVDTDGVRVWRTALPGGGNGGAPTVADFDGDGEPEVGVAGLGAYTMFDTDGSVVWSNTTQDRSSSRTGSSVFDFEGDGVSEVVYADELNLYVYSGPDGSELLKLSDHASGTLYEYPLVADVDNDGSTEIVVPSNDYAFSGWQGITVIGDRHSTWAPARPVWNQFAYSITNVEADSGIPAAQQPNWHSWNNFRAAGSEQGPPTWKADLGFGAPSLCLEECTTEGHALLWLPVMNSGLVDATAFTLTLSVDDGSTATVLDTDSVPGLAAGAGAVLGPYTIAAADWQPGLLSAVLDAEEAVAECDHVDNALELGAWPCP